MVQGLTYNELKDNLSFLDDWEERYSYILELGKKLIPMSQDLYCDENKVRGCLSQVWLYPMQNDDTLVFVGDSDSMLVKGLIAVIFTIYNYQNKKDVQTIDFSEKFSALGLSEHITPQRSNGVLAMVNKIREYACQ